MVIALWAPNVALADSPGDSTSKEAAYVLELAANLEGATAEELAALPSSDIALLTKYAEVTDTKVTTTITPDPAATVAAGGGVTPQAVGCWVASTYYYGTNVLGVTLYQSWHTGRWCSSGSSITSSTTAGQGYQTFWPGWSGTGLIQSQASIVSNQGRSFSQHAFQYQLGTPWPTQYTQPCTRVKGTTGGSNLGDNVCSLY